MKKAAPINIIVHYPATEEGWRELRKRMAEIRANATLNSIQKLKCPTWQKIKLVEAIIEDAKKEIEIPVEIRKKESSHERRQNPK